jgi:hypothetical protein
MKPGPWAVVALLAASSWVGCKDVPYVVVTFAMPAGLEYDGVRVVVQRGDEEVTRRFTLDRRRQGERADPDWALEIPPGETLGLRAQATLDHAIVAEGGAALNGREPRVTVTLRPCGPVPEAAPGPCLDRADAGADAGTPAEEGVDAAADGADAPACPAPPNPDESPPVLPPPPPYPDQCTRYCQAMGRKCPSVYLTEDRCIYACATLAWPAAGSGDSLSCRLAWAERMSLRPIDVAEECRQAAPDSRGACGEACEVYCRMGPRLCPDQFPTTESCLAGCNQLSRQLSLGAPPRGVYQVIGCRLGELELAIFNRKFCASAAPGRCSRCAEALDFGPPARGSRDAGVSGSP